MKKALLVVLATMASFLALTIGQTAFAADSDGASTYDDATIILPFEKTWEDNGDEHGMRPSSITVKLYRYTGDSYSESDLLETATVTAANSWKYDFDVTGDAFYKDGDGKWQAYKFAVVENSVPSYTEVEDAHKDPEVILTVSTGGDDWVRFTSNNELVQSLETTSYPMSFVVAKKGNSFIVWTPERLTQPEQETILAEIKTHQAFHNPHEVTYISGYGAYTGGVTFYTDRVEFDRKSSWSQYAVGSYTRSTTEQYAASITNKPETVDVSAKKVWDDNDNQDGKRPGSVEMTLYVGETPVEGVDPITLDGTADETGEAEAWTATWMGLPKNDASGNAIAYTVKETTTSVITGTDGAGTYSFEVAGSMTDGFTVTNKHTPEKTSVTITKTWDDADDQDGIRPSADEFASNLTLKADGTAVTDVTPTVTVDEDDENTYVVTWTGLPKYASGQEITYTVEESTIDGYTAEGSPAQNGDTITNTHEPELISIPINKRWYDYSDNDGKRPDSIEVALLADGESVYVDSEGNVVPADTEGAQVYVLTLSGADHIWSDMFENLPRYRDHGTEIVYEVDEVDVPDGYESSTEGSATVDGETGDVEGFTITNSHELERVNVTVTKEWDDADNQDGIRPESVTVRLLANGEPVEIPAPEAPAPEPPALGAPKSADSGEYIEATLSEDNNWTYTFEDLLKYNDGEEVEYSVEEVDVPEGYEASVTGDVAQGITVTNSHTPETVSVSVTKVWADANDQDGIRPEFVTVRLLADGKDTGKTIKLNGGAWEGTFEDLPKNAAGVEIVYTVEEVDVPSGYEASVSGSAANGFTITNSHTPAPAPKPKPNPKPTPKPKPEVPKTGEDAPIIPPAALLLASGMMLAAAAATRTKRDERR